MKFFLISDNTDTQMGMRLAGIEGIVVSRPEEVSEALEKEKAVTSVTAFGYVRKINPR